MDWPNGILALIGAIAALWGAWNAHRANLSQVAAAKAANRATERSLALQEMESALTHVSGQYHDLREEAGRQHDKLMAIELAHQECLREIAEMRRQIS